MTILNQDDKQKVIFTFQELKFYRVLSLVLAHDDVLALKLCLLKFKQPLSK